MAHSKLRKKGLCIYCAGCYKLKNDNFTGTVYCQSYRAIVKKVWCADEVIAKYIKTGKLN